MTEAVVENYETTTRGSASMAAYRAVRILQLLSENTGEDKALLSDELVELLAHPDDPARMPSRRHAAASIPRYLHFVTPDTKSTISAAWAIGFSPVHLLTKRSYGSTAWSCATDRRP